MRADRGIDGPRERPALPAALTQGYITRAGERRPMRRDRPGLLRRD